MPTKFDIIVAAKSGDGGIGKDGSIPWTIKKDMRHFRDLTTKVHNATKVNALIMGRKTWESLPTQPLPNRINIVISSAVDANFPGAFVFTSLDLALKFLDEEDELIERVFVIGGQRLYIESLGHEALDTVHLTRIFPKSQAFDMQCDTFFPLHLLGNFTRTYSSSLYDEEDNEYSFTFSQFKKMCS